MQEQNAQERQDAAAEPSASEPASDAPASDAPVSELESRIIKALRTVYDPEIPVNIYEMGLIYNLDIDDGGDVKVVMTLTSPACPVAGSLPGEVQTKVESVEGVRSAEVDLVWDPAWNPSMMSEAAQLELGFM